MDAKQVIQLAKKEGAQFVDLRFTDWPGTWQHCSYPIRMLDEGMFEDGMGFDGSSIRGWQAIHESDMLMVPDPETAFLDPFFTRAAEGRRSRFGSGVVHARLRRLRGRDQVGRQDASRGENGDPERRSSGCDGLRELQG
jgi:hypothetical protein